MLFDAPDDWNNITEQLRKTRSDDIDSRNKLFLERDQQKEEKLFVEADIDMLLESEETDVTNETVSTWLRISIDTSEDNCEGKNSNNNDIQGNYSTHNNIDNIL